MSDVRALAIPYHPAAVSARAFVRPDGTVGIFTDRQGSGWHGVELYGLGALGAINPFAVLSAEAARQLGLILVREAARLTVAEGRGDDDWFVCPCNHYDHHSEQAGLCTVGMTDPAVPYCGACWTPETGRHEAGREVTR